MKTRYIGIGSITGALLWASVANAASYISSYSDLDLGKCALVEEESEIGFVQVKCSGQHDYDVYATEGDLRLYLAYRKPGEPLIIEEESVEVEETAVPVSGELETVSDDTEKAVDLVEVEPQEPVDVFVPVGVRPIGQTIPPFNNLGPKLEWRASATAGAEPFATIVRYTYQQMTDDGSYSNGQVLVVSRFRNGDSCHVAYVDALANANANEMAREVADKYATGGSCPDGAVPVIGRGGDEFRF
ncbi:hypothetical protein QMT40_002073 [Parvibaculaceae bacterium PLY_AMNH_Bact1]|nr:hypothetical protein QMT40_002073 [Parvibaculaceae bacterium PLY_AMNH_Bact1]